MDKKVTPEKMARMDALQKLKEVIDELMDNDFKSNKMPKLMALKVTKVDKTPLDVELGDEVDEEASEEVNPLTESLEELSEEPEVEVVPEEDEEVLKIKKMLGN
jgi:hypothetical protein